jgi:hypothetical protein
MYTYDVNAHVYNGSMTNNERDGQVRNASARRGHPMGKQESYEGALDVGATKLEVELRLVAKPVRGA